MGEWKEFKITDFAKVCNHKRVPLSKKERSERTGQYPYYGASGVIDYVDDYIFDGEYVLISEDGENLKSRKTPIAFKAKGKFWVNNHAHILKGKDEHYNDLLIYYFKNLDLNPFITGAVQPKLNKGNLLSIPIFLPIDKVEQEKITSVLSSLDEKIDLLHRQNATLEDLAETLFRQWFVEETGEDCDMVKIGDYVKTNTDSINKNTSFEIIEYLDTGSLTEGNINGVQILFLKDAPSRARRLVKHNDILISTVRPNQKHYGIIKNPSKNLVVSTGFCVISCERLDPHFIYFLLTNDEMTEYLHSIAEGSTSTYPSLKPSDIERIEFRLPPVEKLKEFGGISSSHWDKIESNNYQIKTLEKLRDALLPKLMGGEVLINAN